MDERKAYNCFVASVFEMGILAMFTLGFDSIYLF